MPPQVPKTSSGSATIVQQTAVEETKSSNIEKKLRNNQRMRLRMTPPNLIALQVRRHPTERRNYQHKELRNEPH